MLPAQRPGPSSTGDAAPTAADRLERAMRRLVDVALGASEELEERVAPAHLRALQALELSGPVQVSSLAAAMALLPSTVSRLSDRLAAAGLVSRGPSPTNRRATLLELTPAGREVLDELAGVRVRRLHAVLQEMADADREALLGGVEAFAEAFERVDPVDADGQD